MSSEIRCSVATVAWVARASRRGVCCDGGDAAETNIAGVKTMAGGIANVASGVQAVDALLGLFRWGNPKLTYNFPDTASYYNATTYFTDHNRPDYHRACRRRQHRSRRFSIL